MEGERSIKPQNKPTFDTGHLFATSFVEEGDLAGHGVMHFDKVWQKQDDLHFVIGQVATAADALSSLNMRATQQCHRGMLVQIFRGESGRSRNRQRFYLVL